MKISEEVSAMHRALAQIHNTIADGEFTVIGRKNTIDYAGSTCTVYSTVGLFARGLPEIMTFVEVSSSEAAKERVKHVLVEVADYIGESDGVYPKLISVAGEPGGKVKLVQLNREVAKDYTPDIALIKGNDDYDLLQLLWPDEDGKFSDDIDKKEL